MSNRLAAATRVLVVAFALGRGATPALAGNIGILALTSDNHLGDFGALLLSKQGSYGTNYLMNMDNGALFFSPYFSEIATVAPSVLSQPGGPAVRVFDFSAFSIPSGFSITMYGNSPAAILSSADMQIDGQLRILNGGGAGGAPVSGSGGPGLLGGGGGAGTGGFCEFVIDHWVMKTPGAGGGGGLASAGQAGPPGSLTNCGQLAGGSGGQALNLSSGVLQGGGGGGAGGDIVDSGAHGSGAGGQGGGAIVFETPGNFTIAVGGGLNADGAVGVASDSTGYGGGGAGGMIWFNVAGVWTNAGVISALGAAGPGGAGSGGYINIDPTAIINHGSILGGLTGAVNLDAPTIVNDGVITGFQPTSPVPEPAAGLLLLGPVAGLLLRRMLGTN